MNPVMKNLVALFGSQAATWGATLLWTIFVPRALGDVQMGRWGFAYSFTAFFALLAGMGSAPYVTMQTARDRSRMGTWVFNTLLMKLPIVALASAVAIVLVRRLGYPQETRLLVAAMCAGMALYVLNQTVIAGLQGEQRMGRTAAWYVVQRYVEVAGTIGVLAMGKSMVLMALCSSGAEFISTIGNGRLVWRRLRQAARVDFGIWKVVALGGLPFMVWDIVGTIYATVDVSMLSFMTSDAVVGWYTVANKLVGVPVFVPFIVMRAFFPELSAQGAKGSAAFADLTNRALKMVVFACAPMGAGIALVSVDLISFFHYPATFSHAIPLIQILAFQIPVIGIDMVMAAAIIANDRQRQWVVVGCLAAVLNPLLNLIAIPATSHAFANGAIGAAVLTVATELFMFGGAVLLRPAGVLDRATIGYLLRCILACLPMLPAPLLAGHVWLPIKIALSAGVYLLASLTLRTISVRQVQHSGLRLFRSVQFRTSGAESA